MGGAERDDDRGSKPGHFCRARDELNSQRTGQRGKRKNGFTLQEVVLGDSCLSLALRATWTFSWSS